MNRIVLVVTSLLAAVGVAQATPGTPDTLGTSLAGGWFFRGSAPRVSGRCPPGSAMMAAAHVDQQGQRVRLRYTLGITCTPPSVCQYEGSITGGRVKLTNTAVVDDEGGRVTNTLDLAIESNDRLSGTATSKYLHPDGIQCVWTSRVEVTRKPDDGSQDSTRPNVGTRQGPSTATTSTAGTSESPSTPSDSRTPPTPGPGSGTSGTGPPATGESTTAPTSGSGTNAPTTPPGTGGPSTPSTDAPPGSTSGTEGPAPGTSGPAPGSGSATGEDTTSPGASTPGRRGGKSGKSTKPGPSSPKR